MITSNAELYVLMNHLIQELKRGDATQWSQALQNALSISTVSSEVLGESRKQLRLLKQTDVANQLNLQTTINESLKYLDSVLHFEE